MALKTTLQSVGTSLQSIASNQPESGVVLKVTSLFISNVSDSDAEVDVEVNRDEVSYYILKSGVIPQGKTLSVFVSKDVGIYLEEGDSLRLKAQDVDVLEAVCSYTEVDPNAKCEPICME